MEITYQNKKEDFEAFYDYMVKETQQGKVVNKQAIYSKQIYFVLMAIFFGTILGSFWGSWKASIIIGILLFAAWEAFFFLTAGFKPRYYYGRQVYRQQEKLLTPKDIQVFLLPRKLQTNTDWLEVSCTEALHRWRWRQVDQLGITSDFIFVHIGVCPAIYIPKRDFTSEQSFIEFGKMLLELKEKNKDQPIGAE
jgi:hypothetical protein